MTDNIGIPWSILILYEHHLSLDEPIGDLITDSISYFPRRIEMNKKAELIIMDEPTFLSDAKCVLCKKKYTTKLLTDKEIRRSKISFGILDKIYYETHINKDLIDIILLYVGYDCSQCMLCAQYHISFVPYTESRNDFLHNYNYILRETMLVYLRKNIINDAVLKIVENICEQIYPINEPFILAYNRLEQLQISEVKYKNMIKKIILLICFNYSERIILMA